MVAPKNGNGNEESGPKAHLTATIPKDLMVEMEHAAAWLSGHPHWLNKSRLVVRALRMLLEHLRKTHNHGKPFGPPPDFPGHQRGRPRKTTQTPR